MSVLESWEGVRVWVMPERGRVEFWVWQGEDCFKLEVLFQDVLETMSCRFADGDGNALLLKVCLLFYFGREASFDCCFNLSWIVYRNKNERIGNNFHSSFSSLVTELDRGN